MSEINVTPMVDVMLVLLIIFMVAAPLLQVGVPIELPQAKGKQLQIDKEPLAISVKSDGSVFIGETAVTLDEIAPKLKAIAKNGYDEQIFVRGDKGVTYGIGHAGHGPRQVGGFPRSRSSRKWRMEAKERLCRGLTHLVPSCSRGVLGLGALHDPVAAGAACARDGDDRRRPSYAVRAHAR